MTPSDLDIWYGESVTDDVSQLFSMTNCTSNNWNVYSCQLHTYQSSSYFLVFNTSTPTNGNT